MSKVTLVFEGDSNEQVCKMVCEYAAKHAGKTVEATPAAGRAESVAAEAPAKPKAAAAKPKAAPKVEEPVEEAESEEVAAEDDDNPFGTKGAGDDEPEGEEITEEQVQAALEEVGEKKDIPTVKKILAEFKLKKVKDLKPEQYAAVLKACKKALK